MSDCETHPAADCFPMHDVQRLYELTEDIRRNGLIDPIVLHDGKILDGRNRLQACIDSATAPRFEDFDGDPIGYVRSKNAMRRDLADDQRRACLVDLEDLEADYRGRNQYSEPETVSGTNHSVVASKVAEQMGESARTSHKAVIVKKRAPDLHEAVKAGKLTHNLASKLIDAPEEDRAEVISKINAGAKPADAIRETRREAIKTHLESVGEREAKAASGVYDVLVIDPPWPMQKIDRDERPNQAEFDYPTMSESELAALEIPAADDCHAWLWTTHKFLPLAFRLLDAWGLKYVCTFVWHKPGGFQPIGLPQYNCEFALYARRGAPMFMDTKALPTCFDAPRGAHSEKPEEFYDVVRRVTAGRRLDMFNRRLIEGFDGWGKEAAE